MMFLPIFMPPVGGGILRSELHRMELWLSVVGVLSFAVTIGTMAWQRLTLSPCTPFAYGTSCDWSHTLLAGFAAAVSTWFFCGSVTFLFFAVRKIYRALAERDAGSA